MELAGETRVLGSQVSERTEKMDQLKHIITERQPIVGAAVGSGMSAAAVEAGGADLLMVLSAGYFRLHGINSMASLMPYRNANHLTWETATRYVIPRIKHTPIFLGVCAQDPYLNLESYLPAIKSSGMVGITNFPSVGFIDGEYRRALEDTGMGFEREVEMLAEAKKHGLLTISFCFTKMSKDAPCLLGEEFDHHVMDSMSRA